LYTTAFTDLFLSQLFSTRNQIESLVMIRSIATAEDIALPNDLSFLNLLLPERFLPVGLSLGSIHGGFQNDWARMAE